MYLPLLIFIKTLLILFISPSLLLGTTSTPSLLQQNILTELKKKFSSQHIDIVEKKSIDNNFSLSGLNDIKSYQLQVRGHPICNSEIKTITNYGNRTLLLSNNENYHSLEVIFNDLPDLKTTTDLVKNSKNIQDKGSSSSPPPTLCYLSRGDSKTLTPVWKMIIHEHGLPYTVYANEEKVLQTHPMYFTSMTSQAVMKAHKSNPMDSQLTTWHIEVDDSGYLRNHRFTTSVFQDSLNKYELAYSPQKEFIFEAHDPRFTQVSVFVHANLAFDYFAHFGDTHNFSLPLDLITFATNQGDPNNAIYIPQQSSTTGRPQVYIGNGDGVTLQNLSLDSDVISHELAHHLIYRTLTKASGESLLLHEGIADFFVYAKTGDSCLGESICPNGSSVCFEEERCLRTASQSLSLGSPETLSLPMHLQSQVISGALWDLSQDIGTQVTTSLVYKSLEYFVSQSGLKHLVLAMLYADETLFSSKHSCKIQDAFLGRGFTNQLNDVNCKDPQSWVWVKASPERGTSFRNYQESPTEKVNEFMDGEVKTTRKDSLCGSVYLQSSDLKKNTSNKLFWWIVLILPLCLPRFLWKRRKLKNH